MIALRFRRNFDEIFILYENRLARNHLTIRSDRLHREVDIAIRREQAVSALGILHLRNVDQHLLRTMHTRDTAHAYESVNQITLRVAIHVFVEVVASIQTADAALCPAAKHIARWQSGGGDLTYHDRRQDH